MKLYKLTFEYVYTHHHEEEIQAVSDADAIEKAMKIIAKFRSPITSKPRLVIVGEEIALTHIEQEDLD